MNLVAAILLVALVIAAFAGLLAWTGAFADLLWMLAHERTTVGLTSVALFILVIALVGTGTSFPADSPTAILVALFVTPLLGRPLANGVAHARAEPGRLRSLELRNLNWRSYIFDAVAKAQQAGYEPPPIGP